VLHTNMCMLNIFQNSGHVFVIQSYTKLGTLLCMYYFREDLSAEKIKMMKNEMLTYL
jgi:hypothetical protein